MNLDIEKASAKIMVWFSALGEGGRVTEKTGEGNGVSDALVDFNSEESEFVMKVRQRFDALDDARKLDLSGCGDLWCSELIRDFCVCFLANASADIGPLLFPPNVVSGHAASVLGALAKPLSVELRRERSHSRSRKLYQDRIASSVSELQICLRRMSFSCKGLV